MRSVSGTESKPIYETEWASREKATGPKTVVCVWLRAMRSVEPWPLALTRAVSGASGAARGVRVFVSRSSGEPPPACGVRLTFEFAYVAYGLTRVERSVGGPDGAPFLTTVCPEGPKRRNWRRGRGFRPSSNSHETLFPALPILWALRAGFEPATPRSLVVCSTN